MMSPGSDWKRSILLQKIARLFPAVAAEGVLVGVSAFEVTEAALVITPADVTVRSTGGAVGSRAFDLDGDGLYELRLQVADMVYPNAAGNHAAFRVLGRVPPTGSTVFIAASKGPIAYPHALQSGGLVGSSLSFYGGTGWAAWESLVVGERGHWAGGADGYLGVKFGSEAGIRYGWIHAVWDPGDLTLTVDQWAYEDTGAAAAIPVPEDPSPELRMGNPFAPGSGHVELIWTVRAGRCYRLERSTDLKSWETIHVTSAGADGEASHVDDGGSGKRCFYRVQAVDVPAVSQLTMVGLDSAAGEAELRWPVEGGMMYELQRSTDLREWAAIHTLTAVADGQGCYLDKDAGQGGARCFYRIKQRFGTPLLLLALGRRRRTRGGR